MDEVPEIIIHVKGGIAEVVKKSLGVSLRIVDWDTMQEVDDGVAPSVEVWTEMDMTREE